MRRFPTRAFSDWHRGYSAVLLFLSGAAGKCVHIHHDFHMISKFPTRRTQPPPQTELTVPTTLQETVFAGYMQGKRTRPAESPDTRLHKAIRLVVGAALGPCLRPRRGGLGKIQVCGEQLMGQLLGRRLGRLSKLRVCGVPEMKQ